MSTRLLHPAQGPRIPPINFFCHIFFHSLASCLFHYKFSTEFKASPVWRCFKAFFRCSMRSHQHQFHVQLSNMSVVHETHAKIVIDFHFIEEFFRTYNISYDPLLCNNQPFCVWFIDQIFLL